MKKNSVFASLAFSLTLMFASACLAPAQSADAQETLKQYISDLQKNPNDYALREKIIRLVQTMKPAPAVPEEAERYMARGGAAVKAAKNEKDFQDAALEFEKASLAAPWLAAAYYNLGITQDKAGKYREAIQSLKLYLLAAPEASDAKAVKTLVYEIEYRQEKAAKEREESSPQAIAAKKQNEYEAWLKKIDGAQWVNNDSTRAGWDSDLYYEVRGREIRRGFIMTNPGGKVMMQMVI